MNLTKVQIEELINEYSNEKDGLNFILKTTFESLMHSERVAFLKEEKDTSLHSVNKGNGYRPVIAHLNNGLALELSVPRDRDGNFMPALLALIRNQETYLNEIIFSLYSKGLTTRDVGDITNMIYGKHYSKTSISRINKSFYKDLKEWRERKLDAHYKAFYIDGIFQKTCTDNRYSKECFYIILGVKEDRSREIVAIVNHPTESATAWVDIFKGIKLRGVETVGLIISDNLTGIENSIAKEFSSARHQLCCVHLMRNIAFKAKSCEKKEVYRDLKKVFDIQNPIHTKESALNRFESFKDKWCLKNKSFGRYLKKMNIYPYLTYLEYEFKVRSLIYTTNWIERFNKSVRKTLKIRGGMPDSESVLALISAVGINMGEGTYKYKLYQFDETELLERESLEKTNMKY